MLARNSLHQFPVNGHELYRPTIEHVNLRILDSSLSVASRSTVFGSEHTPRYSAIGESASRDSLFKLIVANVPSTTSAKTVGVRAQRPAVLAAAGSLASDAALGAIPRQLARRVRSAGIFPDRRRVARPVIALPRAIRVTRHLPGWRRAAGWSGGRCDVDGSSGPVLRNRTFLPRRPDASSLASVNCRPVDPRGSRPANLSTGAIEGWRERKQPNQLPHRSGELTTCLISRGCHGSPVPGCGGRYARQGAQIQEPFNVLSGPSSNRFYRDPAGTSLLPVGARQGRPHCPGVERRRSSGGLFGEAA